MDLNKEIIELEKKELMKDFPGSDSEIVRAALKATYEINKTALKKVVKKMSIKTPQGEIHTDLFLRMFEIICKELIYENDQESDGIQE